MKKIDIIRELHCYKKMYHLMQNAVDECVGICKDPVVKEKLIEVQEDLEDVYTGEEYDYRDLTADELVIVLLLSFIREREVSQGIGYMDEEAISNSVDWMLALKNVKFKVTDAMIKKQTKKIINPENKQKDSEQ